jgi:hypothetical protein
LGYTDVIGFFKSKELDSSSTGAGSAFDSFFFLRISLRAGAVGSARAGSAVAGSATAGSAAAEFGIRSWSAFTSSCGRLPLLRRRIALARSSFGREEVETDILYRKKKTEPSVNFFPPAPLRANENR